MGETVGRRGIYLEDGGRALVELVSDDSDKAWIRYKVRAIKVYAQPWIGSVSEGEEFELERRRGAIGDGYCIWSLYWDDEHSHDHEPGYAPGAEEGP